MGRKIKLIAGGLVLAWASLCLASSLNLINSIRVHRQGAATVVEIAGQRAPNFTTFKQDNPRRIIVDVAEARLQGIPAAIDGDGQLVDAVSARQVGHNAGGISRVIIQLRQEAEYRVAVNGGMLLVYLTRGEGGLLVSAGVPLAPTGSTGVGEGRDLALADELSQPAAVAVVGSVAGEPNADGEPARVAVARDTSPGSGLRAPPAPVGVTAAALPEPGAVSGQAAETDAPAGEAEPSDGSQAEPSPSRPQPVMVAAVYPAAEKTGNTGRQRLLAQQEEQPPADEEGGDEVEEVEEVPVEVVEEPAESAPPVEEAADLPPPPPPPVTEEQPVEQPVEQPLAAEPPPPPPAEERVEIDYALRRMTWVGFQQTADASRVFVKTNAPVKFHLTEEGDRLVVLELENTTIPLRNNRRFLDTHFFDSAVSMITPRQQQGVNSTVRIEIELSKRVPYQATQEDNIVYVSFQRPK